MQPAFFPCFAQLIQCNLIEYADLIKCTPHLFSSSSSSSSSSLYYHHLEKFLNKTSTRAKIQFSLSCCSCHICGYLINCHFFYCILVHFTFVFMTDVQGERDDRLFDSDYTEFVAVFGWKQ